MECEACGNPRQDVNLPAVPSASKSANTFVTYAQKHRGTIDSNVPDHMQPSSSSSAEAKKFRRQTSERVDSIREDDASKALEKWRDIVSICKQVCRRSNYTLLVFTICVCVNFSLAMLLTMHGHHLLKFLQKYHFFSGQHSIC